MEIEDEIFHGEFVEIDCPSRFNGDRIFPLPIPS